MIDVEVQVEDGTVATVTLAESAAGAGDWRALGIGLHPQGSSGLTAAGLRSFRWGEVLDTARREALNVSPLQTTLGQPSDVPACFRADRRGRARRTDSDYAHLALAYLAVPDERRHKAAGDWAARFGGTPGTWRNRIARAKNFVRAEGDTLTLTDKAETLIYGQEGPVSEWERQTMGAEAFVADRSPLTSDASRERRKIEDARRARKARMDPSEYESRRTAEARQWVNEFYSESNSGPRNPD